MEAELTLPSHGNSLITDSHGEGMAKERKAGGNAQLHLSALRNINFAPPLSPLLPKPIFPRRNWQ